MCAFILVFSFAVLKLVHVYIGKSPIIGESREFGRYISEKDTVSISKKVAFTARNYNTGEILKDPSKVEFIGAILETSGIILHEIPVHICN